jgi:MSHA biogenesis protein MshL
MSAEFTVETEVDDDDTLNVWKEIKDILKPRKDDAEAQSQSDDETSGLLSLIGRATVNAVSGTIVVTDRPDVLDRVEEVLTQMQNSLKRQVIIEAKIMEVILNHSHQYGVDWSVIRKGTTLPFDVTSNLSTGTGTFEFNISKITGEYNLSAMVDAIKTQGDVNTISSPRINVINNQSATISIGRTIPYLDFDIENVTAGDTVSYQAVPTVKRAQAGVTLGITPQISGDGMITLHVVPVITDQAGSETFTYNGTTWTVPILDTRTAGTIINAMDNETIVLGGLIQDTSSDNRTSVPILSSIPVVGKFLFGNQARESTKTELVILLTPRIVKR